MNGCRVQCRSCKHATRATLRGRARDWCGLLRKAITSLGSWRKCASYAPRLSNLSIEVPSHAFVLATDWHFDEEIQREAFGPCLKHREH